MQTNISVLISVLFINFKTKHTAVYGKLTIHHLVYTDDINYNKLSNIYVFKYSWLFSI